MMKTLIRKGLLVLLAFVLIFSGIVWPNPKSVIAADGEGDVLGGGQSGSTTTSDRPMLIISEISPDTRGLKSSGSSVDAGTVAWDQFEFLELYNPNDFEVSLSDVGIYYSDSDSWGATPIWDATFGTNDAGKKILSDLKITVKSIPAHSHFIVWSMYTYEWAMGGAPQCFDWDDFKEYFNDENVNQAIEEGRMATIFKATRETFESEIFLPDYADYGDTSTDTTDEETTITDLTSKNMYLVDQMEEAGFIDLKVVEKGEVLKSMHTYEHEGGGYFFNMGNDSGGTYYVGDLNEYSATMTSGDDTNVCAFGQYWTSITFTKLVSNPLPEVGSVFGKIADDGATEQVALSVSESMGRSTPGYCDENAKIVFEGVPEEAFVTIQGFQSEDGKSFELPQGNYTYTISSDCYHTVVNSLVIGANEVVRNETVINYELEAGCDHIAVECTNVQDYRSSTENIKAPTIAQIYEHTGVTIPDNYIFAGWFHDKECSFEGRVQEDDFTVTEAYARFVPKHIMAVKAQVSSNVLDADSGNDSTANIRFATTADNLEYKEIGFRYKVDGKGSGTMSSHLVYTRLYGVGDRASGIESNPLNYVPKYTFCSMSTYFKTWTLTGVPAGNFDTKITVRPFWITYDGTLVYGEIATKTINQGIQGYAARIDGTGYMSLKDALAAVPADGTQTTVELLKDVTLAETLTLDAGQKVVLTDDGSVRTITRGDYAGRLFQVSAGAALTLKGSWGDAKQTLIIDGVGGGDLTSTTSQLLAVGNGASDTTASLTVEKGVTLQNNKAGYGPAIVNYGTLVINGGIIRNNEAGGNAGAVGCLGNGNITMNDGVICDNIAGNNGGGIQVNSGNTSDVALKITGGTITGNTAANTGGAFRADSKAVVTGGTITGNSISSGSFLTSGIYVTNANLTLGETAVVDRVWIPTAYTIELSSDLTEAGKVSVIVAREGSDYDAGDLVLSGDATIVANNYKKFVLPDAAGQALNKTIDSTGAISAGIARIGEVTYTTLADAFAAVPTDSVETKIEVLGNLTLSETITLLEGQNIILTDDGASRRIKRASSFTDGELFDIITDSKMTFKGTSANDEAPTLVIDGNQVTTTEKASMLVNVQKNSTFTLLPGVWLQNNYTNYCGAVRVFGTFNMNGGVIKDNQVTGDNGGGVAIKTTGTMTMTDGKIMGNASRRGGAIHIDGQSDDTTTAFTMTGGAITRNKASQDAGAITAQRPIEITGGFISGNRATTKPGASGVYVDGYDLRLGGAAEIDKVFLKRSNTNLYMIEIISNLTVAKDHSIVVSLNGKYDVGKAVLTGDSTTTLVADNYHKFALPQSTTNSYGDIAIDSTGYIVGSSAKIGDVLYATLSEAIAAVPTNNIATTVTLLQDVTLTEGIRLSEGQNVVLTDIGGKSTVIYRGASYTSGALFTVVDNSSLRLTAFSGDDTNCTLRLDGNQNSATLSPLVMVGENEDCVNAVFTIDKGVILQNNGSNFGGAILVYGSFVMNGGILQNNTSTGNGGAVAIHTSGTMTMNGGTIKNNRASNNSGAIHINANNKNEVALKIVNGTITENTAGNIGGALRAQSNTVILGGTIHSNNSNVTAANGIVVSDNARLTIGGSSSIDVIRIDGGHTIDINSDLTAVQDGYIQIYMAGNDYAAGDTLLTGSNVSTNYAKFTMMTAGYTIDSAGLLQEVAAE